MAGRKHTSDNGRGSVDLPTPSQNRQEVSDNGTNDSSEGSERQYRVPVKDAQGHSERLTLRVHPTYVHELNNLLRSKRFGFRTTNDIVRYGVDLACRELAKRAGVPSMLKQVDAMWDFLLHEQHQIEYLRSFEQMQRQIQDLANSPAEAAKILAGAKQFIDEMPDGYWKERYRGELLTRFGHLLRVEAGKGASLIDGDEG